MAAALNYRSRGILAFHVESVAELATLSTVAEDLAQVAPVSLRFNPDVDPRTHPHVSTGLEENKFGLSRAEILGLVSHLGKFPGVELKGLSVHIGSQITSLAPLERAFRRLLALAKEVEEITGSPLESLDLGGGLGVPYGDAASAKAPSVESYAKLVRKLFAKRPYRLIFEPGRLISANAGALVTEVLYRKVRPRRDFLVVDAGMNDLVRPALYDAFHEIVPTRKVPGRARLKATDVVGPVCETSDRFARERRLPSELNQGDLLAVLSAGAYGFSMSSQYNGRPRPPEVLVDGARYRIVRERERYDDLVRGETP
jgi:diaminopimelate decarboxylase